MLRTYLRIMLLCTCLIVTASCTGPGQSIGALLGAGIGAAAGGNATSVLAGGLLGAGAGALVDVAGKTDQRQQVIIAEEVPQYDDSFAEGVPEEIIAPPVIFGEPCYYPPPFVVTYQYDYYTYENVGGYVEVVFWRGGRRFHNEVWRDHGQRMSVNRMRTWERSHRIRGSELTHHRQLLKRNHNINHPDSHFGVKRGPQHHDVRNDRSPERNHGPAPAKNGPRHNAAPNAPPRNAPTAQPVQQPRGKQIFKPKPQPQQAAPQQQHPQQRKVPPQHKDDKDKERQNGHN